MRKRIVSLLLTAAMTLSLAACGSSASTSTSATQKATEAASGTQAGSEAQASTEAENQGTIDYKDTANINNTVERESITVGWQAATTLAPWGTNNDTPGNYEVYEMLYECTSTGERYGVLADTSKGTFQPGCDHEAGTGVYTVYIYDYIKDHNGRAVTASDVAFSYNYQFANETTSGWNDFVEASAVDDTTVKFEFTKEQDNLGWFDNFFCRCFIVNEESFNESASKLASDMCGTGPYKFVSYTSGSSLVLVKNDDYWQTNESLRHQEQQANVRNLTFSFVTENAQRENGVTTGSLDMVQDMAYETAKDFMEGGQYQDVAGVMTYNQKFIYYLNCNCSTDSLCGNENLRKAIYYAVDQDGLCVALGGGFSRLYAYANDYYSDYTMVDWASLDNYNTKTGADLEKSKEYLAASGYNGESLTMLVQSTFSDTATIIAAQCAAAGINVKITQADNATLNSTLADPTAWDMYFGMMAGDYNVQAWSHDFYWGNTADGTHSQEFVADADWEALLELCNTEAGHTAENMKAWWDLAVEHAYCMGIYAGNNYNIVPNDCVYVCQGDKLRFLPGACCFSAN